MINPLVSDLSKLTDTEVDEKIQDLQKKYFLTQNLQLRSQMTNILEIYKIEKEERNVEHARKEKEMYDEQNDIDGLINIS